MNKKFTYVDVLENSDAMEKMLKLTRGTRKVPVIVENEKVIIGFNDRA